MNYILYTLILHFLYCKGETDFGIDINKPNLSIDKTNYSKDDEISNIKPIYNYENVFYTLLLFIAIYLFIFWFMFMTGSRCNGTGIFLG